MNACDILRLYVNEPDRFHSHSFYFTDTRGIDIIIYAAYVTSITNDHEPKVMTDDNIDYDRLRDANRTE